jgi:N-acylneuraminate cytidylyltransferase
VTICIIPARGGSRRIERKNVKAFHGKPIIAHSIETAVRTGLFDTVVVSTDDEQIGECARSFGAATLARPPEFAQDECGTQEVTRQAIESMHLDRGELVVCLYATAPLVTPSDLSNAVSMLLLRPCSFVVAVGGEPLRDAGAFYVGTAAHFLDRMPLYNRLTGLWPLPAERVCDINVASDWTLAEALYAKMHGLECTRS